MVNIDNEQLTLFLIDVYEKYGDDFIHYNHETLKRRIVVHCIRLHVKVFEKYRVIILDDKSLYDEMFRHFSINVTEFFREPEQLKIFREKVIPYINSYQHVKIWCAGCSSGESPYSMAIMLEEAGILDKCQIYATDFNNRVLAKAKKGLFEIPDFKQSYTNYELSGGTKSFKEYFIKKGKYHQIKKHLQKYVLFFNHNLVTDGVMNEFQVVICKNVMIYFDNTLKAKVINLFNDSLMENGFLVLGSSEYLLNEFHDRLHLYVPNSKIYHKKISR